MRFDEFMRATRTTTSGNTDDGEAVMTYEFGRDLFGAFEGVFGGVVAAAALRAAHELADGRRPIALDVSFVRGLPAGVATATAHSVRSGRSLTFIEVDVRDADAHVVARASVTFANPDALHPLDADGAAVPVVTEHGAGHELPPMAPIMETLAVRFTMRDDGLIESSIVIPWDEPGRGAEAACLAADISVGAPVGFLLHERKLVLATPNPDLSLRFLDNEPAREFTGVTGLEQITTGLAVTRIQVVAAESLVAAGLSCTVLLAA